MSSIPLGNITLEDDRWFRFNTHNVAGEKLTITGTPTLEILEDGNDTAIHTIVLGVGSFVLDAKGTGSHKALIPAKVANGFVAGKIYSITIEGTAPLVDGVNVEGSVIAHFSCQYQYVAVQYKKNVAYPNFSTYLVLAVDNKTPAIGKTVTCYVQQDGGGWLASSGSVVEISDGFYRVNFTAGEMNGGTINLRFEADASTNIRTMSLPTNV